MAIMKTFIVKLNRFFVCRECGQTFKRKIKPSKCKNCGCTQIGELQIEWKN